MESPDATFRARHRAVGIDGHQLTDASQDIPALAIDQPVGHGAGFAANRSIPEVIHPQFLSAKKSGCLKKGVKSHFRHIPEIKRRPAKIAKTASDPFLFTNPRMIAQLAHPMLK
jgi:hypothetical protein